MRTFILFFSLLHVSLCIAQPARNLFDSTRVTDIHLDLAPGQWERLQENYLLDTYYEADLKWESDTLSRIGIRSRGNGSRSGVKPGLKLNFDKYKSGQNIAGFKELVLDNLLQDRSMIAEFLSFQLYNKVGVPAPREAFVRVFVNGESYGLYTIVEQVNKPFLKRNFKEDSGYLYDYEWTDEFWFEYRGADPALYFPAPFAPQTNEKSPEPRPLIEMLQLLKDGSDAELPAALSRYLDVQQFLDFLAVETYLAERDGMGGDWGVNNFYLYRSLVDKRMIFIPWDRDGSFGLSDRPVWLNLERNVLTKRILEIPEYRDYFFRALDRVVDVAGAEGGWLDQERERTKQLIRPFAFADRHKPYPDSEVDDGVDHIRQFLASRAAFVRREITR